MHSSLLLTATLAASAVARRARRDLIVDTETDIVYTTTFVTVTAGQTDNVNAAVPTNDRHRPAGFKFHKPSAGAPSSVASSAASLVASSAPVQTAVPTTVIVPTSTAPAASPPPASVTSESQAPASQPPASQPPASQPPASQPPASQAPASQAPATPSAAPSATGSAPSGVASTYADAAVERHNFHRANHGAGAVTWSQVLADSAMIDAKKCTFKHWPQQTGAGIPQYGQNLALGPGPSSIGDIISKQWYDEQTAFASMGDYGQAQPDYGTNMASFEQWGHFTQVVWKGSSQIGCASYNCANGVVDENGNPMTGYGGGVTYCFYATPGNYAGEYAANVGTATSTAIPVNGDGIDVAAVLASYNSQTGQSFAS